MVRLFPDFGSRSLAYPNVKHCFQCRQQNRTSDVYYVQHQYPSHSTMHNLSEILLLHSTFSFVIHDSLLAFGLVSNTLIFNPSLKNIFVWRVSFSDSEWTVKSCLSLQILMHFQHFPIQQASVGGQSQSALVHHIQLRSLLKFELNSSHSELSGVYHVTFYIPQNKRLDIIGPSLS